MDIAELCSIRAGPRRPAGTALEGRWRNPSGIISITRCGESLCGRVQWASDKSMADARKGGTNPLVGAELLCDIVPKGEGRASSVGDQPTKSHRLRGRPPGMQIAGLDTNRNGMKERWKNLTQFIVADRNIAQHLPGHLIWRSDF